MMQLYFLVIFGLLLCYKIRPDLIRNWRRGRFKLPLLEISQEKLAKEAENSNLPRPDFFFQTTPAYYTFILSEYFIRDRVKIGQNFPRVQEEGGVGAKG